MTNQEQLQKWIDDQDRYYPISVIGQVTGKRLLTTKETITLDKCKSIVDKLTNARIDASQGIKIYMSQYDYSDITPDDVPGINAMDYAPRCIVDKTAYYYPKTNTLQIWERGLPIYENANGHITRDRDALADCLL